MNRENQLARRIRVLLLVFAVGLVLSGLTAFPLVTELNIVGKVLGVDPASSPEHYDGVRYWIALVGHALRDTGSRYPFLAYGTDWLAFAHLVIAVAFIGPLRDPVRNIWVLEFGMIACLGVIPLALIAGEVRGIPFYWRLIDSSFGVFGFLPLWFCRRDIKELAQLQAYERRNVA